MAHFLIYEDGPFEIGERFRRFLGLKEGAIQGFFPLLFSCIFCLSVWTAIFAYLLWLIDPIIIAVIAAMTVALVVDATIKGR